MTLPGRKRAAPFPGEGFDGLRPPRSESGAMNAGLRRGLRLGGLLAFALLVVGGTPHFHAAADGPTETCVPCHGADAPLAASGDPTEPARSASVRPRRTLPEPVRPAQRAGGGSRAPPIRLDNSRRR